MPSRQSGQRDVLAIFLGAVMFATMMIEVRVVDERRNQEWDATQQIPHETEGLELTGSDMHQFVDEQRTAVIQQR